MANRQYDDKNRGSIWRNERKETDNHPDFTGSLNVDGRDYWVSAWKRKEGASDRAPALSFSIKPKDGSPRANNERDEMRTAHARPQQTQGAQSSLSDDFNDEIPFAPEFR